MCAILLTKERKSVFYAPSANWIASHAFLMILKASFIKPLTKSEHTHVLLHVSIQYAYHLVTPCGYRALMFADVLTMMIMTTREDLPADSSEDMPLVMFMKQTAGKITIHSLFLSVSRGR